MSMMIIGERVNATRRSIAQAIRDHDEERIVREICNQDQAGAHYIDLNAGSGHGDLDEETANLKWLIDIALRTTEKRLSLDSSDATVIQRAAESLADRRPMLLNSANGEAERLRPLMALAAERGYPVIALAMDDNGIPNDVAQRLRVCEAMLTAAADAGVPEENVLLDPLVLPVCNDVRHAQVTLSALREIKARFPRAKTTLGLSNVSHGLPRRTLVNQAFLIAALANGLDSAICDPTDQGIRRAITLGDLLAGRDRHCRRYARRVRKGEIG
jgi:5-methyltetrahydrofolate--homocysteine methyltransferase